MTQAFSDELKAFARLLADRLRDRATDIADEHGESDATAALHLVAEEMDEVIHEGPHA